VLNQIFTHTQFETVMGCTMLVVDHNRPVTMNLVQVLDAFIDHRLDVVLRRSIFELKKAEARAHILEGLLKALDNIDEVVEIIRKSANRQAAADALIARFEFSVPQVNAILDMRLHQLTGLTVEALRSEMEELIKYIAYLKEVIGSREKRLSVIREELLEIKEKYATPRLTEITSDDSDLNIADLIPRHNCVITVSDTGFIKRIPADTYGVQHRGGKGIIGMETREEDHVAHLFNAHSHDLIFFFTNRGFMYWLNVYEIPEGSRQGKGRAIVNLVKMEPGERICAMLTVTQEELQDPEKYIVMASKRGYIKKTELQLFKNLRRIGLRALVIEEDDDLIGAAVSRNGDEVLLSTKLGMACRFDQTDEQIRPMGRTARGVTGMRFKIAGDEVVSLEIIREHSFDEPEVMSDAEADDMDRLSDSLEAEEDVSSSGPEVLVVTDGGMGKRSCVSTYRKTNRGARGVLNIRLRENESVLGVVQVTDEDELMMSTERGQLSRIPVHEIRRVGRAAKGVIIMRLNAGDRITGVSKVAAAPVREETPVAEAAPEAPAAPEQGSSQPETETPQAPEQE
ncbi:MAG: DNA gyrase subunit A, partial [Lentisphaeria bacterium]|nr:DNA gyrase subunit A [Lentisphaeria bacterium]